MRRYGQVVQKLQKLLDLMTGLRKVRENIPRKETVASVFKQRRELVRIPLILQELQTTDSKIGFVYLCISLCMRTSISSATSPSTIPSIS